ncbi:hypothetical protein SO802_030851 [Lithocarpus litseifolius]|uniref:Secoisolariciresinol dehydrogenase n=1 Tax=Lithocarpus litseifolius TaxID=425828 RepID=A0AAW2BM02_9ROSI
MLILQQLPSPKDIQDELGHSLCKEIGSESIFYIHCDVTNESDVEKAIDKVVSKYGKLDIMFNNAGISGNMESQILKSENENFKRALDVNIFAAFLGAKHDARVMIPVKKDSILFTSSVALVMAGAVPHSYVASKHAMVGMVKNLSVELGQYGIRVNCVSPFSVATPMLKKAVGIMEKNMVEDVVSSCANLKGVVLEPEDIAEAPLYLGSDESKYVSGMNLVVDGGGIRYLLRYDQINPVRPVLIADVKDELGHSICKDIGSDSISYIHCDVTNEYDVEKAADMAATKYGKLDIMFNNVGISSNIESQILESENEDFERVLNINIFSAFLGAKHAARVMIPTKKGSIPFTSIVSKRANDVSHAYVASKHAVVDMAKNLSVELGQCGIRVNCVSLFAVGTPMVLKGIEMEKTKVEEVVSSCANLKGVVLEPEDIVEVALYIFGE